MVNRRGRPSRVSDRPRLVLVATNLLFQSRIAEAARALGFEVTVAESGESVREALRARPVALLVLDLQAEGVSWQGALAAAKQAPGGSVPVLAYGQHTKPALLRAARLAGCDHVVPRSTLVEELPSLIGRLASAANR